MLSPSINGEQSCPPGKKESVSYVDAKIVNKTCISLQNIDVGEYNVPSLSLSLLKSYFIQLGFAWHSLLSTASTSEYVHSKR
jgi:hypothetical protein